MSHSLFHISFLMLWAVFSVPQFCGAQNSSASKPAQAKTQTKTAAKPVTKTNKQNEQIKKLEQEKRSVDKKVQNIGDKLSDARKSTTLGLQELERLNNDIKQRDKLINSQSEKIKKVAERIESLNQEILQMEMNYNVAKRKYVDLVYHAYQKNSVYDRLLFVFSARNVQESIYRFNYISQFATIRRRQASEIQTVKLDLVEKKQELEDTKNTSEVLLAQREEEKKRMQEDQARQKELVNSLRKQEKQLRDELKKQQKSSAALNKKIQDLIAKEAERVAAENAKKAKQQSKNNNTAAKNNTSGPNNKSVNKTTSLAEPSNFAGLQGRMHWPVWKGGITGHFGKQPHPVLKDVTVDNKGVYITSPAKSDAIAVYEGTVTQIFSIPGSGNAVILRHGNFLTVYANLSEIYVKQGDKVKRTDRLGKMFVDPEDPEHSHLFFQIWKEKYVQNPEIWLRPLK